MQGTARGRDAGKGGKKTSEAKPVARPDPAAARTTPRGLPNAEIRLRLLRLADDLARHQSAFAAAPEVAPKARAPGLVVRGLRHAVRRLLLGAEDKPRPSAAHRADAVCVDHPLDTAWADPSPEHSQLVHIFHQEWHGIRAAAGYLPGHKVAVAAEQRLSLKNAETVVQACARARGRTVVIHGWSENAALLVHALRETLGSSVKLKVIWHGNTSQFINSYEHRQVGQLIEFRRKGLLDGLGSVKPDLHLLHDAFSQEVLLNVAPSRVKRADRSRLHDAALLPMPLDWRKNVHTNLAAAAAAGVGRVYVTAELPRDSPTKLTTRVISVLRPGRQAFFTLIGEVDVILNASLSECQPMTALEGLALGVPCITGLLCLGELDRHPYQQLVQVAGVDTLGPVVRAIRAVRDRWTRDPRGLADMMADYERVLRREAFARLERFLE